MSYERDMDRLGEIADRLAELLVEFEHLRAERERILARYKNLTSVASESS